MMFISTNVLPSRWYGLASMILPVVLLTACQQRPWEDSFTAEQREQAIVNASMMEEGLFRCQQFTYGWLAQADPETGLIPRNLERDRDIWNAKDAAADNYPFMVLTAAFTDQELFQGRMRSMLDTETRLTSRVGALPDTWSFSRDTFVSDQVILPDLIFGASEYIKDGLLPLTEWIGPSPWSERMISMLNDLWDVAEVSTPYGTIPSENPEVNGEMLQTLSRVYWMTGEHRYLEWAIRLGDYYLLGNHHPTYDFEFLRLRDHGCEVVSGLCELYATLSVANPAKREAYRQPLHRMLDRILEVGRNQHGLFYNVIDPGSGDIINDGIADNFGYTLNGFYTVYMLDSTKAYLDAVLLALSQLEEHYRNFDWEHGSADGYADAIEGALNLYQRESVPSTARWIDSEMKVMWNMQKPNGIIEGWHGDGNFARTTLMYILWKTQGTRLQPWSSGLQLGAVRNNDGLLLFISTDTDWEGRLYFDLARHKEYLHLPFDWPRINQFPEWYTWDITKSYQITGSEGSDFRIEATTWGEGVPLRLNAGSHWFVIRESED